MRYSSGWLVVLVVAFVFGGAARSEATCVSAPDPALDQLWTRSGPGWTGGDGTFSVALPDGRIAWIFGDSFLGTVNLDRSRSRSSPFVRNALVVQNGATLTTMNQGNRDWLRPTTSGHWYWPADGTVANGKLHVFLSEFQPASTASGYQRVGQKVAVLSLPTLALEKTVDKPIGNATWGRSILEEGSTAYIYGTEEASGVKYAHLARAPLANLLGPWQYWNGTAWTSDANTSARILDHVSAQYSVIHTLLGYRFVTMGSLWGHSIYTALANGPTGPWQQRQVIYTTPDFGPGSVTYNPSAHPEISVANGDMVISYNINSTTSGAIYQNADLYRPRFFRASPDCLP
jgi:uncharacterized protein DUF5005